MCISLWHTYIVKYRDSSNNAREESNTIHIYLLLNLPPLIFSELMYAGSKRIRENSGSRLLVHQKGQVDRENLTGHSSMHSQWDTAHFLWHRKGVGDSHENMSMLIHNLMQTTSGSSVVVDTSVWYNNYRATQLPLT